MSAYGPYSSIRQAGNIYFISGQVGIDPKTKLAAANISAQTKQVLDNLELLLTENGLQLDNISKTTIYLTSMDDFAAVNEVYVTYFNEPRPARACVEVSGLPKLTANKLLIEIEAVAYKS